jgi:pyruvate/2-oxoglutarate dehydrogenase complex dihydrolipoamide acyltransferase (E2) component
MSKFQIEDEEVRTVTRRVTLAMPMRGADIVEMLAHVSKEVNSDAVTFTTDDRGLHARYTVVISGDGTSVAPEPDSPPEPPAQPVPQPSEPVPPTTRPEPPRPAPAKRAAPAVRNTAAQARAKEEAAGARARVVPPFVASLTQTGGKRSKKLPTLTLALAEQMLFDLPSGTYYFRLEPDLRACPSEVQMMEILRKAASKEQPRTRAVLYEAEAVPSADAFVVTTLHD